MNFGRKGGILVENKNKKDFRGKEKGAFWWKRKLKRIGRIKMRILVENKNKKGDFVEEKEKGGFLVYKEHKKTDFGGKGK